MCVLPAATTTEKDDNLHSNPNITSKETDMSEFGDVSITVQVRQ